MTRTISWHCKSAMLINFFLFSCFDLLLVSSVCGVGAFQFHPSSRSLEPSHPLRTFARTSVYVPTRYSSSLAAEQNIGEGEFVRSIFNSWCQVYGRDASSDDHFEIFAKNYRTTQDAFKGTAALFGKVGLGPHADRSWEEYVTIVEQDEDYLSQMTVKDLKEECKRLNLKVGGTKAVLVEKLQHGLRTIAKSGELPEQSVSEPKIVEEAAAVVEELAVDDEEPAIDISIPYDAPAMLAYEASDKSMAYEIFKAKYEADAVAEVMAKYVDLSIPYDAAAKLAYEASDMSMVYDDFKAKYEADAVADIIAKQVVEQSKPAADVTPPPSPPPRIISQETVTNKVQSEQKSISTDDGSQTSLVEDIGGFVGSVLTGILESVKEKREQEMLEAEKRKAVQEAAAIEATIKRREEVEEFRARKERESKEAEAAREKEQKARRAEQDERMRKIQENFENEAVASSQGNPSSMAKETLFTPTPPTTPPPPSKVN